jgi:hypothetical protein
MKDSRASVAAVEDVVSDSTKLCAPWYAHGDMMKRQPARVKKNPESVPDT